MSGPFLDPDTKSEIPDASKIIRPSLYLQLYLFHCIPIFYMKGE